MRRNDFWPLGIRGALTKSLILLLCFSLALGGADVAFAAKTKAKAKKKPLQEKLIMVEAEGAAPIVDGRKDKAHEAAKQDLNRNALEKAIGTYVESVTEMEDFQVITDRVISKTHGLVKRMDIKKEWIDEDDMLHLSATCGVAERSLDGALGPVVIDSLGNPRIMVLLDERIDNKTSFLSTAEGEVLRVFEKAGYMIVDAAHAQTLSNIDMEAARASNDPEKLRAIARDFRADVLITGKAYANTYTRQSVNGVRMAGVQSSVQLRAVLADSAQMIGSDAFTKREIGLSSEDGAIRGFKPIAAQAASSIVNKVAYALVSGSAGGLPGRTVKVVISGLNFNMARALRSELSNLEGVTGVYQRRFQNGNLELDVVSDKTAEDVAGLLADQGYEITGVSAALVEGRGSVKGGAAQ